MPTQTKSDVWLRRFHPATDGAPQLICFPHAGGAASFFFPISAALTPGLDVSCVQYPGRQDRRAEPGISSITALADQLFQVLPAPTGPFALFGHSMGATIAFELARRLERAGTPPTVLFLSGRRGPSVTRAETVHQRDDHGLIEELKLLSGTDATLLDDPDIVEMILPSLRADYRAIETYRKLPGPPLSCPIVMLTGSADPRVTRADAEAWAAETDGPFTLEAHPGGHFYLTQAWAQVNDQISRHLQATLNIS
jgi:surfactin synthase thioesterase subunit